MANYLIKKTHHDESVVSIRELDGYTFKPRLTKDSFVRVNEVTIVDKVMIDKILTMKFNKSLKKVVQLALKVINDEDADDGDATIVLGEVELVREILLNRYQKFLSYEKEQLFLKKLRLIENELRMKQVDIKRRAQLLEMENEKTRSRGM